MCRKCESKDRQIRAKLDPEGTRRSRERYNRTWKRAATRLSYKGALPREAKIMARAVNDPYSRCSICGVPGRILSLYHRRRVPVPSTIHKRWKLEIDRLRPGGPYRLSNTRILCPGCNAFRGPSYGELKTDGEVLANMRRRWHEALDPKYLWWLNTMPGAGGRPFRGLRHERDEEGEDEVPAGY